MFSEAAGAGNPGRVKFRLVGNAQPLPLVPVEVNGTGPYEFILDTGAGTTLVTPELASRLALQKTGSKEGQTAGGKVNVSLSNVDALQVGRARAKNLQVGITDLTPLANAIGAKVDGDLGYNFLRGFCLTIDYARQELELGRSPLSYGTAARAEAKIVVPNAKKPLILVETIANGRGSFQFAIDTGTSTTAISPQLARDLRLPLAPMPGVTTGAAQIAVSAAQLGSLAVGAATVANVPVIVGGFVEMLGGVIGTKLDGILGYNYLRAFRVVIDYPNGAFRLE